VAQLFYNDCAQGKCRKAYVQEKQNVGNELYRVKSILLTYRRPGTTDADEQNRSAVVFCGKSRPTVTWSDGKAQVIDKGIFANVVRKNGKVTQPEAPVHYDETTSLWKAVCSMH
jgi:hypothetical protein